MNTNTTTVNKKNTTADKTRLLAQVTEAKTLIRGGMARTKAADKVGLKHYTLNYWLEKDKAKRSMTGTVARKTRTAATNPNDPIVMIDGLITRLQTAREAFKVLNSIGFSSSN